MAEKSELEDKVAELFRIVGLDPSMGNRVPHEFSGGQRQRIGIARALACSPSLVICDEPISALDVSIQAQIINLLEELQERLGLTYLFIAHDLAVVQHISDRVAVMYLGRIVELADSDELYENPLHPYTQALYDSIPRLTDTRGRKLEVISGTVPNPLDFPEGCRFHPRCRYAIDICRRMEPPMAIEADGHQVRCLKYNPDFRANFSRTAEK